MRRQKKKHMNSCKDVAIIIVNYNGYEDTIECINSILTAKLESKIIIVDNASEKNEAKMINDMFPNVTIIRSDTNNGFSAGNNLGIRYALENGFDYILLLNNDTIIDPKMINELRNVITSDNICVPKMLYYTEPNKIWYGGGYINKKTGNAKHCGMNSRDYKSKEIKICTFASGCSMMISADIFNLVGLLDEDYFMYCEDTDFCIRLTKAGIKIKYIPEAVLWHKVGNSTTGSDSLFSTYYMTRNRLYCIKKNDDYFEKGAYYYSLISRYIRAFECFWKRDNRYKYFLKGIKDYRNGVIGRVDLNLERGN